MVIKGGLQGQPGNPHDPSDEGVFISKINEGGCIYNDYSESLKVNYPFFYHNLHFPQISQPLESSIECVFTTGRSANN